MATNGVRPRQLVIGALARRTGTKTPTIRYYESIGLMPPPARSAGNQRIYDVSHLTRLAFIRHSRELQVPLEAIRELLTLADDPDQSCEDADRIATEQLAAVRRRISRLRALETELQRMTACRHTRVAECRVIEVLGNHDLCENEHHGDAESLTVE